MSVSLALHPAQNLLAAHADNETSVLAIEPVRSGTLLILVILGLVLLVVISQVLGLVWRVIREALPMLGILLLGLGVVVIVAAATLTKPGGGTPDRPTVTTTPPSRTPVPRPTTHVATETSLAPLGGARPTR